MLLNSINPTSGKKLPGVKISTQSDIKSSVAAAKKAYLYWKNLALSQRLKYVKKFLFIFEKQKNDLAKLESEEMGKPYQYAKIHLESDNRYLRYYLENSQKILSPEIIEKKQKLVRQIIRQPLGVSAVITPWNFPYTLAIWGIIPNLICGNTVVYKPSELTPLCGAKIMKIFEKAGFPKGVVNIVQGDGKVGKALIEQDIDFVWFTGSSATGQKIYEKCGQKFIRCLLELGGSSPAIVFDDVDIKKTAQEIFAARFSNCGQICSSVKRLFIHRKIFKSFLKELINITNNAKVGDPFDNNTTIGPLVSKRQLQVLEMQVADAVKNGAVIETGGRRPKGSKFKNGFYYLPTVLTNVNFKMKVLNEEVFGPVLPVVVFNSLSEAVELANNTEYGLTALVYTSNKKVSKHLADNIQAGVISINTKNYSFPNSPFGGWKKSGMGVEGNKFGFHEMTRVKYICSLK